MAEEKGPFRGLRKQQGVFGGSAPVGPCGPTPPGYFRQEEAGRDPGRGDRASVPGLRRAVPQARIRQGPPLTIPAQTD
ncbi:hypothetical protein GCM10011534_07340 [Pseudooceanicola nanhaiensis]|uniref:Uncharacterized protein n=1 Tax=Pseudooceanicola nanhaiensis TaxID=375761 RepID=A0A917SN27_9RHOB|nr:hypothetical protein GCM10011534_07340 [Pseudooceanicola nanhaiensis]